MHPAFRVSPDCRINFPPMTVELEPAFTASLVGTRTDSRGPSPTRPKDASTCTPCPRPPSRRAVFFYGTGYQDG